MATKDISRNNGPDTLKVSENAPLFDLLDHMSATMSTADLLDSLSLYAAHVEEATEFAVTKARAEGETWETIGRWLGMTRQGAQQRYGA